MTETIYVFDGNTLELTEEFDYPLQVADSFLVSDGRVRSLEKHKARFNSSAEKLTDLDLALFWDSAIALLPRVGEVFPRIELSNGKLVLRLRKPVEFKPTVVLWTADEVDDRIDPTTKGPDLAHGAMLRRKSNLYGADEAVLVNQEGFLIEGALSSVLWWKDDVLCGPDEQTHWLPSVTRSDLFELAGQAGYETATEHLKPSDLIGLEVWAVSSLTGIRPVVDWVNLEGSVGPQKHLESFQRRLKLMSSEI